MAMQIKIGESDPNIVFGVTDIEDGQLGFDTETLTLLIGKARPDLGPNIVESVPLLSGRYVT
jgi:hypothetical protein